MVIDYSRHCYHTEAKLWRDRDTLTPITWFRAADDAEFFPGVTFMGSVRTWERPDDNVPYLGERPNTFQYSKGAPPTTYLGDHFCGRLEDFEDGGETDVSEEMETNAFGAAPCCEAEDPVSVCGYVIPRVLWAKIHTVGGCSCGNGQVVRVVYHETPVVREGFEFWQWWGPEGFEPPLNFGPYPPGGEVTQLGTCENIGSEVTPLLVYPFFGFSHVGCDHRGGVTLYFNRGDGTLGIADNGVGVGAVTGEAPFEFETPAFLTVNFGNCVLVGSDQHYYATFHEQPPD